MRKLVLAVVVLFAMMSSSCDDDEKRSVATPNPEYVGKCIGKMKKLDDFSNTSDIFVYEHEGNLIYCLVGSSGVALSVVPKKSSEK